MWILSDLATAASIEGVPRLCSNGSDVSKGSGVSSCMMKWPLRLQDDCLHPPSSVQHHTPDCPMHRHTGAMPVFCARPAERSPHWAERQRPVQNIPLLPARPSASHRSPRLLSRHKYDSHAHSPAFGPRFVSAPAAEAGALAFLLVASTLGFAAGGSGGESVEGRAPAGRG